MFYKYSVTSFTFCLWLCMQYERYVNYVDFIYNGLTVGRKSVGITR